MHASSPPLRSIHLSHLEQVALGVVMTLLHARGNLPAFAEQRTKKDAGVDFKGNAVEWEAGRQTKTGLSASRPWSPSGVDRPPTRSEVDSKVCLATRL